MSWINLYIMNTSSSSYIFWCSFHSFLFFFLLSLPYFPSFFPCDGQFGTNCLWNNFTKPMQIKRRTRKHIKSHTTHKKFLANFLPNLSPNCTIKLFHLQSYSFFLLKSFKQLFLYFFLLFLVAKSILSDSYQKKKKRLSKCK